MSPCYSNRIWVVVFVVFLAYIQIVVNLQNICYIWFDILYSRLFFSLYIQVKRVGDMAYTIHIQRIQCMQIIYFLKINLNQQSILNSKLHLLVIFSRFRCSHQNIIDNITPKRNTMLSFERFFLKISKSLLATELYKHFEICRIISIFLSVAI